MTGAELFLTAVAAYLLAGLAFGVAFVTRGVTRIDPAALGTSAVFRVLILPGTVARWPFLAVKWANATQERLVTRQHRQAHVWAWFAVSALVGLVSALWLVERLRGGS